jgi:hypothetical protein
MKKTKELQFYAIALLILAFFDLIMIALGYFAGDYAMVSHESTVVKVITNVMIIVVLVCSLISVLVGVYLGVKGIMEAKKPTNGRLHIVVAKAIAIFNIVLAVITGLALFGSTDVSEDITTFGICVADAMFMFSYANAAKAVQNGEE